MNNYNFPYNGTNFPLPGNLSQITLANQQAWSATYGMTLTQRGIAAEQATIPVEGQVTKQLITIDQLTQALSFYTGIPLQEVMDNIDLSDIITALGATQIIWAIQGAHSSIPEYKVPLPEAIVMEGIQYVPTLPSASVSATVTHDQFAMILQLSRYALELMNGDWTNFQILCAAFVRVPGEELSRDLISADGERVMKWQNNLEMRTGMGLAQFFLSNLADLLLVLDKYTTSQVLHVTQDDPGGGSIFDEK